MSRLGSVIGDTQVPEIYRDRWRTGERARLCSHSRDEPIETVEEVDRPDAAETVEGEATPNPTRQPCSRGIDTISRPGIDTISHSAQTPSRPTSSRLTSLLPTVRPCSEAAA